jgi:hypothetical protein
MIKRGENLPTHYGQVLDTSDLEDDDVQWLGTAFQCRKHIDHDSHLGGDGRNADDYKVIDSKRGGDKHKSRHHKESKKKHERW